MTPSPEELTTAEDKLIFLQTLLQAEDTAELCHFFAEQTETEIALLLESFPASKRDTLWACVPETVRGRVLAELGEDIRSAFMAEMEITDVSDLAKDLDAQDIAELLDTVEDSVKDGVIENLTDATRDQVEILHSYDDDSVGRYMDPETVNVKADVTLETVQRFIRINGLLDDQTQEVIVTNNQNKVVGSLSLIDLVKQNQQALVSEFLSMPTCILDTTNLHDAATILRSKELRFAPVVNERDELVGQLNTEDIMVITREDSDTTLMTMSGVSDDEELFAPIMTSAKSRGIWLGINLATAFLASFVIGRFEAVISQVVALAVLMPVVASMGGIAGSQTLTVIIRGLAMGQVGGNNRWWLFNKELWVGALNGLAWAVVVGFIAELWFQDTALSLVIALAIVINMTIANVSGIAIPLMLKRMKIDPALSGAVILTTVTDVVGFMSFLGLATVFILK